MSRPCAATLDLDNLWAYLKAKGDPRWKEYPSYLETFIPDVLDLFDRTGVKATFFIVGKDAAVKEHFHLIREIAARGHEVGNHSFHHDISFCDLSFSELNSEIVLADEAIQMASGVKPAGFRAPGFSWNPLLVQVLPKLGYRYDSSMLPTFIGPFARLYHQWVSGKGVEESSGLYGSFRNAFLPNHPFFWKREGKNQLLEIPVTTIPYLKVPFHMSYLHYLGSFSYGMMRGYLRFAIRMCVLTNTRPCFLLHPTDFMGKEHVPELAFFPGMNLSSEEKKERVIETLNTISEEFVLSTLENTLL